MKKPTHKVPQIRFPEFNDEWELTHLNEILEESKIKNKDLKYDKKDVLSVSGDYGIVNQIEHLGRSYAGASVHNYGVVEVDDIVYTKSPLKSNPFGIIKVNKNKPGIVSTLYAIYKAKTDRLNVSFIDLYFSLNDNTNRYLRPLVRKGAKNDMKINNDFVLSDTVYFPKTKLEQDRIVEFLEVVESKINLLEIKLTKLEEYKKGISNQLFIERSGFTNDLGNSFPEWEKKKMSNVFERVKSKNKENNSNVLTISSKYGLVSQTDYFNKSVSAKDVTNYYLINKGDFAYNKSYSNGYPMGAIKRLNKYEKGVVSTLYICFRIKKNYHSDFFEQYFESGILNKELKKIAQEGARNHGLLNLSVIEFFRDIDIYVPSIEEQIKIASFLSNIDEKIKIVSIQLEHIKEYKKALLQQMFCY